MQKGSAIFFTVIVVAILLGITFGLSTLLFGGLESTRGVGNSKIAFYAAEAGIEHVLFIDSSNGCNGDVLFCIGPNLPGGAVSLGNGATYVITAQQGGSGGCSASVTYCAQSIGTFRDISRKIEIER